MLCPFAHPVACCWMSLCVVAQSLKPVKLFSQQLPIFLLFRDRWSVAQQFWIRLHRSSNIVGATHAHYDTLHVPNLLGVVASVCTPLPTRTQQLPTLLAQQCWELLRPFARSLMLPVKPLPLQLTPPQRAPKGNDFYSSPGLPGNHDGGKQDGVSRSALLWVLRDSSAWWCYWLHESR